MRILVFLLALLPFASHAQKPVNWTPDQLMEPATLASTIEAKKNVPVILSVGPGASIPGSVAIGMTVDAENMKTLKAKLSKLPKDTAIVLYCGCCPFDHCPNVRPAIDLLRDMKFTNYKLLNLPHNLKADWIDKGFPNNKKS